MRLTITIDMDNAAFEPHRGVEVARILEDYCQAIADFGLQPNDSSTLFDINGNTVGKAEVTK
jgi:hypothetical protein